MKLAALVLLLSCGFSLAQSAGTILIWDPYDVDENHINGYHAWHTVSGGEIQPAEVLLIRGVIGSLEGHDIRLPHCCWGPDGGWIGTREGCYCGKRYWPQAFAPAKFVDAMYGEEVCLWVSAYREVGNPYGAAESGWAGPVCYPWPLMCGFSDRPGMCACFGCGATLGVLGEALYPTDAPPGIAVFGDALDGPGRMLLDFGGAFPAE